MKIGVIGAGAMGATHGGRLAASGSQVLFVDTWPEHVAAIDEGGLHLVGVPGDMRLSVPAFLPDAGFDDDCDVALVCVDSNNTAAAATIAALLLKPDGFAVPLQNGIGNVEILVDKLGATRVAVGSTMCSAITLGPGHVDQTHEGLTTIGERDGRISSRLRALKERLVAADFAVEISADIMAVIWTKFTLNVAINALCATTGLRLGEVARQPEMDAFQDHIIDEVLAVVAARNITLTDPDIRTTIKDHCWSKFSKPSMLQHIERAKTTEIDALNGAVVREARELGIATPYNEALTALTKGRQFAMQRAVHEPDLDYDKLERQAGSRPGS